MCLSASYQYQYTDHTALADQLYHCKYADHTSLADQPHHCKYADHTALADQQYHCKYADHTALADQPHLIRQYPHRAIGRPAPFAIHIAGAQRQTDHTASVHSHSEAAYHPVPSAEHTAVDSCVWMNQRQKVNR